MHDIKAIRETPDRFIKGWTDRKLDGSAIVADILAADQKSRAAQTEYQNMLSLRNEISKNIAQKISQKNARAAKSSPVRTEDVSNVPEVIAHEAAIGAELEAEIARLSAQVAQMKVDLSIKEQMVSIALKKLSSILETLPNIMQDDVPVGPDETANVEIHKWGNVTPRNDAPEHFTIGEQMGQMSAEMAAKMSGARFTILHSGLARLERALGQFMIDTHTNEHGYTEVSVPLLVRDNAMYGVGMLPKFGEDMFKTTSDHYLIPTAEASLTNMVADMIVDEECLPLRVTAMTPCFRSEAGSAGKDTRGMIRQHQFYKVEMVSVTTPEQSRDEHERMTECAENILKKLELPFRRIVLCTGDAGFCSQKTYDLEVWLGGQGRYREISSCSNCGDFQARRMNARTRERGAKETRFVHTLNGSGIAVGRALIAVMENYYNAADNTIAVPAALRPYMNGAEKISAIDPARGLLRTAG